MPNYGNIPKRVRNCYTPPVQKNVVDALEPPIVHIDTKELARTITTIMTKRERYQKSRDIIEHAKKYGAYDFYGAMDPSTANKWIKTVKKTFNTLQLSDEEKMSNVYSLMVDKADN